MNNNLRCFFLATAMLFLLFSSCEKKEKKVVLSDSEIDSLHYSFTAIEDSLTKRWERMIEDDNDKLADAQRLLEEISYTNQYSKEQYDTLKQNIHHLKEIRYSSQSMANSDSIDYYDSASNKVINEIIVLATSHPEYQRYPLMKELVEDIQAANGRVLRHRVNYDYAAKLYNQFLEEHEAFFERADSLKNLERKPLFELSS